MGLNLNALNILSNSVDSLTITDNKIVGLQIRGAYHIIEGNVVTGGVSGPGIGYGNIIFRNNIFSWQISEFTEPTIVFTNNLFLNGGINTFGGTTGTVNVTIKNCIFFPSKPTTTNNSTFLNNICFQTIDTVPAGSNTGSGNMNNTDPEFVSVWVGSTPSI